MNSSIRSKAPRVVKQSLSLALLIVCAYSSPGRSEGPPPALEKVAPAPQGGVPTGTPDAGDPDLAPPPAAPKPGEELLPEITARGFGVKVVKRSSSGKTYLFDDITDAKTRPGKILLLKREGELIMAFRVVKTYPEKKQLAAKRVRRYGDHRVLDTDEQFNALEKVGDLAPPPQTPQDKADLKELEGEGKGEKPPTGPGPDVQAYDPDLDAGSSPPPNGAIDSENSRDKFKDEEEDDSHLGMTVDEVIPLDPNNQWITGSFGFIRNSGADGNAAFFAAGGVRYGLSVGKMIFLRRAHVQDSIVVEGGLFYYKILNFVAQNDAYSVISMIGTLRYNIMLGESFGVFLYGGVVRNSVTSSVSADANVQANLALSYPAGGMGMLFRVGPSWDLRVDLGVDIVGLGLVLRF